MELRMMMLIALFLSIVACSDNKHSSQNNSLDNVDERLLVKPNKDWNEQYFLPISDEQVILLYGLHINGLYQERYSKEYDSYESFKKKVIAKPEIFVFDTINIQGDTFEYYEHKFLKEESVMNYYEQYGIEKFMRKYLIADNSHASKNKKYKFKRDYANDHDKSLTIAYCMWLSGYEFFEDCMVPDMWFERKSKI